MKSKYNWIINIFRVLLFNTCKIVVLLLYCWSDWILIKVWRECHLPSLLLVSSCGLTLVGGLYTVLCRWPCLFYIFSQWPLMLWRGCCFPLFWIAVCVALSKLSPAGDAFCVVRCLLLSCSPGSSLGSTLWPGSFRYSTWGGFNVLLPNLLICRWSIDLADWSSMENTSTIYQLHSPARS